MPFSTAGVTTPLALALAVALLALYCSAWRSWAFSTLPTQLLMHGAQGLVPGSHGHRGGIDRGSRLGLGGHSQGHTGLNAVHDKEWHEASGSLLGYAAAESHLSDQVQPRISLLIPHQRHQRLLESVAGFLSLALGLRVVFGDNPW